MKSIVIYKSKTGYTQQYAKWISEELQCEMVPLKNLKKVQLSEYDTVIYGGGIYATNISGFKTFLNISSQLANKKVAILSVGAAAYSDEVLEVIRKKNMDALNVNYQLFYVQGGFDPNKLSFFMKFMLSTVAKNIQKKSMKNPNALTKEDKAFLDFFQSAHSDMSKANVSELIAFVKK